MNDFDNMNMTNNSYGTQPGNCNPNYNMPYLYDQMQNDQMQQALRDQQNLQYQQNLQNEQQYYQQQNIQNQQNLQNEQDYFLMQEQQRQQNERNKSVLWQEYQDTMMPQNFNTQSENREIRPAQRKTPGIYERMFEIYGSGTLTLYLIFTIVYFIFYCIYNVTNTLDIGTDIYASFSFGSILGIVLTTVPEIIGIILLKRYAAKEEMRTAPFTIRKVLTMIRIICSILLLVVFIAAAILVFLGGDMITELFSAYDDTSALIFGSILDAAGYICVILAVLAAVVLYFYICVYKNASALKRSVIKGRSDGKIRLFHIIGKVICGVFFIIAAISGLFISDLIFAVLCAASAGATITQVMILFRERSCLQDF